VLAEVRAELREAGHHAFAWRLGADGAQVRSSDDGEPGGSAGRPILAALESRALTQVVAIVSRIFGGTRLGVGGLKRAYGGAAAAALEAAEVVEVVPRRRLLVRVDWKDAGAVEALLAAEGLVPLARGFDDGVRFVIELAVADAERLVAGLRDHTLGRAGLSWCAGGPGDGPADSGRST
jgi:putative IMPACT (imprinted ancient) family translation regulator